MDIFCVSEALRAAKTYIVIADLANFAASQVLSWFITCGICAAFDLQTKKEKGSSMKKL